MLPQAPGYKESNNHKATKQHEIYDTEHLGMVKGGHPPSPTAKGKYKRNSDITLRDCSAENTTDNHEGQKRYGSTLFLSKPKSHSLRGGEGGNLFLFQRGEVYIKGKDN